MTLTSAAQQRQIAQQNELHSLDQQQQPLVNGYSPQINGVSANSPSLTSGPVPNNVYPPSPQSPVTFTQEQILALKVQIKAYQHIAHGLPIPEELKQALRPNAIVADVDKILQGPDVPARIVDAAAKIAKAASEQPEVATSTTDGATDECGPFT